MNDVSADTYSKFLKDFTTILPDKNSPPLTPPYFHFKMCCIWIFSILSSYLAWTRVFVRQTAGLSHINACKWGSEKLVPRNRSLNSKSITRILFRWWSGRLLLFYCYTRGFNARTRWQNRPLKLIEFPQRLHAGCRNWLGNGPEGGHVLGNIWMAEHLQRRSVTKLLLPLPVKPHD